MEKELIGRKGMPLSPRKVAGLRELGILLKRARLGQGLSQRGLQRRSHVHQSTISRLENGRLTHLSLQRLARLIQALRGTFEIVDD